MGEMRRANAREAEDAQSGFRQEIDGVKGNPLRLSDSNVPLRGKQLVAVLCTSDLTRRTGQLPGL